MLRTGWPRLHIIKIKGIWQIVIISTIPDWSAAEKTMDSNFIGNITALMVIQLEICKLILKYKRKSILIYVHTVRKQATQLPLHPTWEMRVSSKRECFVQLVKYGCSVALQAWSHPVDLLCVQDVCLYCRINPFLMLARNWLNANIGCSLTAANGLSHIVAVLLLCICLDDPWIVTTECFFSVADVVEVVEVVKCVCQIVYMTCNWNTVNIKTLYVNWPVRGSFWVQL